jgi:hypothetical protein
LANSYKKGPDDPEETFPLGVAVCPGCRHLQLTHFVEPDKLFKNYLYVSGTTADYKAYLSELARGIAQDAKNILDIGCNDGSFLDAFKKLGLEDVWRRPGREPRRSEFAEPYNSCRIFRRF